MVTFETTTGGSGGMPMPLADRLVALGQQAGLSEVFLFRLSDGPDGQHIQCLARYPTDGVYNPTQHGIRRALRLVAETANPFITLRRARHRDGQTSPSGEPPSAIMIAPVLTFDSAMWGALVGISPDNSATGWAFRSVIQTAEQIGGQVSSWGRVRSSAGPVPVKGAGGVSLTSSATLLHELRTPLSASSFALDVIERVPLANEDERVERALRILRLAITEAIHVVHWWGEAQENGQVQPHIRPIPIEAVLRQSLALVSHYSGRTHVTIAEDMPLALADELMLTRVFVNLIENAFRHGQPDGTLEISTTAARDVVQVRFLNEGVIPASALRHITDSTWSRDATLENSTHGYGLGIVNELVKDMGGHVVVESDRSHWTAFTVTLRAAHPESAAQP